MRDGPVIGNFRVQEIARGDGRREYTIMTPDGLICPGPDQFLRTCAGGTDRSYAYLLVDHLRWLADQGLTTDAVSLRELARYMGVLGAEYAGPFGLPWRNGRQPLSQSSLASVAACLKRFYSHQGTCGVNTSLAQALKRTRLPTRLDKQSLFLGHVASEVPSNPLAPKRSSRRSPKLPPQEAREVLVRAAATARDRLVVTWLADGGFRIGELCSLHLVDLHLREDAECGECSTKHVHICHREGNTNRARVKIKADWSYSRGVVRGGHVRRASPAMIHTYFDYMTSEYPRDDEHGMLLVQLQGPHRGRPWSPAAARGMLQRLSAREGLGKVRPHAFRHQFATKVLEAANGNAIIARDAGGWASATTVEEVYGHMDVHDPVFVAALQHVWDQS